MRIKAKVIILLAMNLMAFVGLGVMMVLWPPDWTQWFTAVLFGTLIVFAMSFSIVLADGLASLLPLVLLVGYLVLGYTAVAPLAFIGAWLHGGIRWQFGHRLGMKRPSSRTELLILTAANSLNNVISLFVGVAFFQSFIRHYDPTSNQIIPFIGLGILAIGYFVPNQLLLLTYFAWLHPDRLPTYSRQIPYILFYESIPVLFTPLAYLIYLRLGIFYFSLTACLFIIFSFITHWLNRTRQRLERRVQELNSLHQVSQTISASLDMNTVLSAIYAQVKALMPVDIFYIALYDPHEREISFPLFYENDQKRFQESRRPANGLTEYILHTRHPFLGRQLTPDLLQEMGIASDGENIACWLGVPMLVADEVIGVISVQSARSPDVFSESDRELLMTIAGQAGLALQNARQYADTYRSLSQRVQELDSIFRTTHDGILLFGRQWELLAVNRAASFHLGVVGLEAKGQIATQWPNGQESLIKWLGFSPTTLTEACQKLSTTFEGSQMREQVVLPKRPNRYVERTLVPVLDVTRQVSGWLVVLRDITEEVQLGQLREDMMHMLVHDLRTPLSLLLGSLELGQNQVEANGTASLQVMLQTAEKSGQRMLHLINDLLDVYKLEAGKVPLSLQPLPVRLLLTDAVAQFTLATAESHIQVQVDITETLPFVLADYDYLGRVLFNLMDNAVKFTPDNGHIRLWACTDTQIPLALLIGISDSGPGISAEMRSHLFQKFRRGVALGRRKGTGLGLAYCKLVVEAHGGQIWVESDGQHGSTFMLRLPSVRRSQAEAPE